MEKILNEALSIKIDVRSIIGHCTFNRITIWDSTAIELPESFSYKYKGSGGGASAGALKLQYSYDLLSQKTIALLIQDAVHPDNKQELGELKENDLRIEDLGYFKLQRLEQIQRSGAFFFTRYKFGVLVYELKNQQYQEIDLLKIQRRMKSGNRRTLEVFIGKNEKFPVRMIIEKIPLQVANEKRRRLKTDKQVQRRSLTQKRLILCDLNIYITNTTQEQLPCEEVRQYYSLRWQIEIIFKAWKSIYHIDKIKKMKLQRFECVHYGTLILIILTTHLLSFYKRSLWKSFQVEVSELKFFKILKSVMLFFKLALIHHKQRLPAFLDLLGQLVYRVGIKQRKSHKITPLYMLNAFS